MSQVMSQSFGQHMRLEQRLTPQLIQSMDILQLNVMSLENRIAEELEKNVALELVDPDAPVSPQPEHQEDRPDQDSDSFRRLDTLDREYNLDDQLDRPYRPPRSADSGERDAKMDAMANTASRPMGLDEHLINQLAELNLDEDLRQAGQLIVYHLDEDGYLRTRLEDIAQSNPSTPLPLLEKALPIVQRLDPRGVAAREYQECLLIQLEALPGDNTIERILIEKHLQDVVKNRYPAIAKATGFSVGEITEAVKVISSELHLHPALVAYDRKAPPIFPDAIIDFDDQGSGLTVRLAKGNDPMLRVSKKYADLTNKSVNGKDVRDFVRKHVDNAKSLIEALKFRRNRLLQVAEAVAERQKEFFEVGPQGLKVLRMSDLAHDLECDPSTISRTVSGKYVQTPRGIYPLRYFFTSGPENIESTDEATSWDSVRERVKEIIEKEDKRNPLNDDQVVEEMHRQGMELSRRTVAKYRQLLDIPSARQRKVFS